MKTRGATKLGLRAVDLYRGSSICDNLEFVRKSQYWSTEELEAYQSRRLQELVSHAYSHVPYYKKLFDEHGIRPNEIQTKKDLVRVPILTKKILRENLNDLVASNAKRFKPTKRSTGGTTGAPLTHFSDINTWSMHWALKIRAWTWAGYYWGDKIGVLAGSSLIPNSHPPITRRVWNRINNFYPMSAVHFDSDTMEEWIHLIEAEGIKQLRGYPTSIYCLAKHLVDSSRTLSIDGVFTTAEVLQPAHKEMMKKAFNCVVIDSYGCADGGGNASTCEMDNGFHVSAEASIMELTDNFGNPVQPNETGEVTLTNLTNFAMPTLRYKPEDLAIAKAGKCTCGRNLPMLERIVGRSTDVLSFANGRMIGGPAMTLIMRNFSLEQYQLIQNQADRLDVCIVPLSGFNSGQNEQLLKTLSHHCGEGVNIIIHKRDYIEPSKSGKFRFVINNMQR